MQNRNGVTARYPCRRFHRNQVADDAGEFRHDHPDILDALGNLDLQELLHATT